MKEIYSAFINFQKEFKGLKPDASNPFFKSSYITLDGILETIRPLLTKHGLAVIQNAFSQEGQMAVKTILIHESGQSIETDVMTMKPVKDDPQQRGSVITYMKRYQLGALVGICESVDDDANTATFGKSKPSQKPWKPDGQEKSKPKDQPQGGISEPQIKAIYALTKKANVDIKTLIAGYDVESVKNLTKKQASEIISKLQEGA